MPCSKKVDLLPSVNWANNLPQACKQKGFEILSWLPHHCPQSKNSPLVGIFFVAKLLYNSSCRSVSPYVRLYVFLSVLLGETLSWMKKFTISGYFSKQHNSIIQSCISVCISFYLSILLSFCLFLYLSFCFSVGLSVFLSVCITLCLSTLPYVFLFTNLSKCPSICLFTIQYVNDSLSLSICLSVCLCMSFFLAICLYIYHYV